MSYTFRNPLKHIYSHPQTLIWGVLGGVGSARARIETVKTFWTFQLGGGEGVLIPGWHCSSACSVWYPAITMVYYEYDSDWTTPGAVCCSSCVATTTQKSIRVECRHQQLIFTHLNISCAWWLPLRSPTKTTRYHVATQIPKKTRDDFLSSLLSWEKYSDQKKEWKL